MLCKDCVYYVICSFHDDYIQCADGCKFFHKEKVGYWFPWDGETVACSECKGLSLSETAYCPDCGARMEKIEHHKIGRLGVGRRRPYSSPNLDDKRYNGEYRNSWNED